MLLSSVLVQSELQACLLLGSQADAHGPKKTEDETLPGKKLK